MSEEQPVTKPPATIIDVAKALVEGGLPQIVAGPAGKAISRLIGGATDVPAAWLEQKAQKIKDDTSARSEIMKAVAKASAAAAVADPALLDRALDRHIAELYRKQENREAIAQKVFQDMSTTPPDEGAGEPAEDWMNVFEEYAAKASSEQLRETWARVLSGEIRKPNSFSLKTLQFLSVLDQPTAAAAETLLSYAFDNQFVLLGQAKGEFFSKMQLARLSGLIGQVDVDTLMTRTLDTNGVVIFVAGDIAIVARGEPQAELPINCTSLSWIAREIASVVRAAPSELAISGFVSELKTIPSVQHIQRGLASHINGTTQARNLIDVWRREQSTENSTA